MLVLKERDIPVLQYHSASDKERLSYDNTLTNLRSIVVDEYLHGEGDPHSQASAALSLRLFSSHEPNGDQLQQWLPAQDLLVCCLKGDNKLLQADFMKCIMLLCTWKFRSILPPALIGEKIFVTLILCPLKFPRISIV